VFARDRPRLTGTGPTASLCFLNLCDRKATADRDVIIGPSGASGLLPGAVAGPFAQSRKAPLRSPDRNRTARLSYFMGSMPESPLPCKAIMPNNHHPMKKNCPRREQLEIKLRDFGALFPFLSFQRETGPAAVSGD